MARLLLFCGEKTSAGAVFRDAAGVDLAAGAGALAAAAATAGCLAVVVAARTRFLGIARSTDTFSLSSLVASSLLRFLPRVEAVGTDLEAACFATGLVAGLGALTVAARARVVAGATRAFGAGARAGVGADVGTAAASAAAAAAFAAAFFVGAFLVGAALSGADAGFGWGGGGGTRSSIRGI